MSALLEARSVSKVFGGGLLNRRVTVAVEDISLVFREEQPSITVIAGESGSGKTTLARLLLGIISPTSGDVRYQGQGLHEMSRRERRVFRREVQAVFQDPFEVYNPFYKVDHVLTTPVARFKLAQSRAETQDLIENALLMVGLRPEDTLGRYPHQLSGGQRQRIMVARALLLKPRIILADEPVSMVDASLRATILESLLDLHKELGISLVYITHDLTTAYQVGENIVVLYQGSVVEAGDVELVIKDPQHPYTQVLVGSIPLPDPRKRWAQLDSVTKTRDDVSSRETTGCKFADRCPAVMPACHENPPPLYQTDSRRAVSCYLYADSRPMDGHELDAVLSQ